MSRLAAWFWVLAASVGFRLGNSRKTLSINLNLTDRREDAKKKTPMETYWVPGLNNNENYGRWAFVEFTEVFEIEAEFNTLLERTDYEN